MHIENIYILLFNVFDVMDRVECIRTACRITDDIFSEILRHLEEFRNEKDIDRFIRKECRKRKVKISFRPIVASGKNGARPHHYAAGKRLEGFCVIDFGVKVNGYCSDMTRTFVFGKPTKEQKKMIDTVLEAQQKTIESVRNKACDVDKAARDYIKSQGYPDIPHSVGHGIGLEVHEHPHISKKSKEVLKNGMVFSIEPGIYLHGFGGVRIEDLFVLENNRLRKLTNGLSQN